MNINKRESYLTVAPTDGDKWSSLGLRFLIRAGMDFIIEPRTVLINGVETVVYPIDGVIQEKTYRQQLASYSSTRMIHSLLETIEFVDNSEFLSRHNIVLDEEFIYWDTSNETGKFVVVPVEAADSADEQLRTGECVFHRLGKDKEERPRVGAHSALRGERQELHILVVVEAVVHALHLVIDACSHRPVVHVEACLLEDVVKITAKGDTYPFPRVAATYSEFTHLLDLLFDDLQFTI